MDVICDAPLPGNPSHVFLKGRWPKGLECPEKIMASCRPSQSQTKRAIFIELLRGETGYSTDLPFSDLRGGVKHYGIFVSEN